MRKILISFLILCFTFQITHGDIVWDAPSTVSVEQNSPSDPRIVMDPAGNVTVAWLENHTVKVSSLPFSGDWSKPIRLSGESINACKPKLGVDSKGNVTALWIEDSYIRTSTLSFAGEWSVPEVLSDTGASNPSLAVDQDNNAVAIWVRNGFIESATRLSGSWNKTLVISAENSNNPHLAISSSGIALAAWHWIDSDIHTIASSNLDLKSNTWTSPQNIFDGTATFLHDFPKIAIDDDGNATVGWFRYNIFNGNSYQNVQIMTSSLSNKGLSWTTPVALSGNGLRKPSDLMIKLRSDSNGDILAVWTNSYDGERFTVESSLKLFGGRWPTFATPQNPSLYSFGIDLASSSGSTLLTNMSLNEFSEIQIQSQETDTTNPLQAWSHINTLSIDGRNGFPQCAMCAIGKAFYAVTIWVHFDGKNKSIQAATGTGPVISPPIKLNVIQDAEDLGLFNDYYNTITWGASSDEDILQYSIFRNGVSFAATNADTLQFIDHNAERNGTVTYGVAALNSAYRQSEIVSFTLNPKTADEIAKEQELVDQQVKKRL